MMLSLSALEPFKNQLFSMQKQQPIWSQEHGALLKKLRENARLDVSSLAHRNTVSKSQVVQLEDGGDTSFYNPDIKYSIGKKLLKFLGHDLIETTAAQPTPLEPAKTIQPEPLAPSDTAVYLLQAEPMASAPIQPTPRPPAAPQNTLEPKPAKAPSPVTSKNMAWGLLLVGMACFAFFGLLESNKSQPIAPAAKSPVADNLATAEVKPSEEEAKLQSQEQNIQPTAAPADTAPSAANSAAVQQAQAVATAMSENAKKCLWKDAETELVPATPKKAPEYVYMVATKDMFVCVMDGNERVAALNLKNGERRSIYGPAPFKVQSTSLPQLQVFFQGTPIAIPSEDIKQIKLSAVPWK
jgi:transcriptional regulator with XRE-family HTH domain